MQTLKAGALFLKHVKSGSPHPRFVYLSDDGAALQWVEEKDKAKRKDAKEIRLAELTDIHKGHATPVFSGKYAKETNAECCFSLVSPDRSLDVQCDDARTRDFWVNALVRLRYSSVVSGFRFDPYPQYVSTAFSSLFVCRSLLNHIFNRPPSSAPRCAATLQ